MGSFGKETNPFKKPELNLIPLFVSLKNMQADIPNMLTLKVYKEKLNAKLKAQKKKQKSSTMLMDFKNWLMNLINELIAQLVYGLDIN